LNHIDIYFFTGTGNTLYIVNQLKEDIPDIRLNPVVSLLSKTTVNPETKMIVLCFPNHAGHIPIPMKLFNNKLALKGDESKKPPISTSKLMMGLGVLYQNFKGSLN
jgi:flavodoxin